MEFNLYDIVMKLNGPIEPLGESNADERRFNNLKNIITMVELILQDIHIASHAANRHEDSMKKIGKYAKEFLEEPK